MHCSLGRHHMALDLAISGEVYWGFIDSRFYGPFRTANDRLGLLGTEERLNIDVVESKMRQASEGTLISHYSIDG